MHIGEICSTVGCVRIPLSNPLARALFSLIVISICASLAYLDGKSLIAAALNSTSTLQLWETAARLEPYDAAYWEKLGLYREWDKERRDLVTAARYFQRASQLDPLSAKFELELANASCRMDILLDGSLINSATFKVHS